ncbi:hypothetical protein AAFF_G00247820 [Aldrovandia affinis]|uniref:Uncharacterized protein n=1 Tax=Aldrovandia affinis TaxID=143900 RepID=A0AAD7RD93_9TELE|nr:hypothetical protein AAFF_G00247820 [Aldrovandia affinis]
MLGWTPASAVYSSGSERRVSQEATQSHQSWTGSGDWATSCLGTTGGRKCQLWRKTTAGLTNRRMRRNNRTGPRRREQAHILQRQRARPVLIRLLIELLKQAHVFYSGRGQAIPGMD